MSARETKTRQLLEHGARLFHERGYNATGVKDIVDAAGVPKGSFYTYFPSKEEFTVRVIEYYAGFQEGGPLEDETLAPLDRIRVFFDQVIQALQSIEMKQGCLVGNMCQEMADHNESIRRASESTFTRQEGQFLKCLQEAREQGQISSEKSPEQLAGFILNSWQGYLLRMKASRDVGIFDEFRTVLFGSILA